MKSKEKRAPRRPQTIKLPSAMQAAITTIDHERALLREVLRMSFRDHEFSAVAKVTTLQVNRLTNAACRLEAEAYNWMHEIGLVDPIELPPIKLTPEEVEHVSN